MEKKVGCVIAYGKKHTNYGTSLVGYALIKKIQQLGYSVEVINYIKQFTFMQKVNWIINSLRCGMGKQILKRLAVRKNIKNNPAYAKNISVRTNTVYEYKKKKLIPIFKDYKGFDALQAGSRNYDVVVVGSDQVWLPHGLPTKFFNLLFVDDNVRKVAYASSFGVSEIPKFQHEATGKYLDRFYKISVREQNGKKIVDSLSNNTAEVVADPTMLLTREEWEKEISENISASTEENKKIAEKGGYIFCYFLGSNSDARKAAMELKKETNLPIITLRHMDEYVETDEQFGDEAPYSVDANDFIRYIANADYVCTDSFHCTVFSILFHKKFMTFYRFTQTSKTGRNSRIDSLFELTKISKSHIFKGDISGIFESISWDTVDEQINILRNNSIRFLEDSLK